MHWYAINLSHFALLTIIHYLSISQILKVFLSIFNSIQCKSMRIRPISDLVDRIFTWFLLFTPFRPPCWILSFWISHLLHYTFITIPRNIHSTYLPKVIPYHQTILSKIPFPSYSSQTFHNILTPDRSIYPPIKLFIFIQYEKTGL